MADQHHHEKFIYDFLTNKSFSRQYYKQVFTRFPVKEGYFVNHNGKEYNVKDHWKDFNGTIRVLRNEDEIIDREKVPVQKLKVTELTPIDKIITKHKQLTNLSYTGIFPLEDSDFGIDSDSSKEDNPWEPEFYKDYLNNKKYDKSLYYKNEHGELLPYPFDEDYYIDEFGDKYHKRFYIRNLDGSLEQYK